ncbi:MAG TPA: rod shape-determining protein MreC [Myxococcales bacterium]|nr:rod shape-determining protein MreC [Myxococcales bacterium]HIN86229.1 rod shape-determining protein MreC [Myxococcales bacterium]
MFSFLGRHRAKIVGFLMLTLPLASLWYHGLSHKEDTVYERVLDRMTSPAQNFMSSVIGTVSTIWSDYVWLIGIQDENVRLRKQHETLSGLVQDREQLKKENRRLKALLAFKGEHPELVTVAARVVAKDVSPFHRVLKIKISAGANHGVRRNQPVVTSAGVVGHVDRTVGDYAVVKLAVDAGNHISVDVGERDIKGVVNGSGDKNTYLASFIASDPKRKIRPRDMLVTNGEDERFPRGLVVGYVGEAQPKQEESGRLYQVIPAVPFATLSEVLVVISSVERIPNMEDRP